MKKYSYKMSEYLKRSIFSPCRDKVSLIRHLTDTMKELCYAQESKDDYDLVIIIDKFQRIFFMSENKIYSLAFPFRVIESKSNNEPHSFFAGTVLIDSFLLSNLETLIQEHFTHNNNDFYDFCESMFDTVKVNQDVWLVLRQLCLIEEGYIRYDFDPNHYDAVTHPLHHLDIFYSPGGTFKIGLDKGILYNEMIDILHPRTNCRSISV